MGFDKEKIRQVRWLMVLAAVLVLALMYSSVVFKGLALGIGIIKPFIIGGAVAFALNLPMRGIENTLFKRWKGKAADRLKRPVSMVMAIVAVVLVINLVIITVLPQVTKTAGELGNKIPVFVDNLITEMDKLSKNYPQLQEQVAKLENLEINWEKVVDNVVAFLKNGVGSVITSTYNVASSIIGGVVNGVIALIFALYILNQKEKLASQGRRILSAYLPKRAEKKTSHVLALLYRNFSNFITGQCLEAVILGTMFVISMTIFRMPYAVLVGVLIAFTALIPIVGAFIGCVVGAFLILINNPIQAVWFVVLFLVLQQIEGNLIYPKVVGSSVGLPSIWVLMAVSVGGSLFGIAGMLFFIPLMSTLYSLLRDSVNSRNQRVPALESAGGEPGDTGRQGNTGRVGQGGLKSDWQENRNRKKNKGNTQEKTRQGKPETGNAQAGNAQTGNAQTGNSQTGNNKPGQSGKGNLQEEKHRAGNDKPGQSQSENSLAGKADKDMSVEYGKKSNSVQDNGNRSRSKRRNGRGGYENGKPEAVSSPDVNADEEGARKFQDKSRQDYRRKWQETADVLQEDHETEE